MSEQKAVTISELLGIKQIVAKRQNDLIALRNANSTVERNFYGANADKHTDKKPTYNAAKLDKLINSLARESRLIDVALKNANATITVPGYTWNDDVLGELEQSEAIFEDSK